MDKNFSIGVDLGGTNLKAALVNRQNKIISRKALSTECFSDKFKLINAICVVVTGLIRENKLTRNNIGAIGLGLPGPIDFKRGIVHFFPNIPGWKEVALKKILEKRLKVKAFIDNDVNLMCLAEHTLGAAAGYANVVCLTLGTGVGGGLVINNKLYRGGSFAAGELGHIPLDIKGPKCNCGGSACLEVFIGNKSITHRAKQLIGANITPKELSRMAKSGNKKARLIWDEVGNYLGVALCGVVNLLNPDCIVIGGGVSGAGNFLFDKVKKVISKRAMSVQAKSVKVLKAKLGNDAGLIGASILARKGLNI